MGLRDVITGRGLGERMSLPQALNEIRAGRLPKPPDGPFGALMDDPVELPLKPPPEPPHSTSQHAQMMLQRIEDREKAENKYDLRIAVRAAKLSSANSKFVRTLDEVEKQFGAYNE
jgi:hypothetical protein